MYTFNQINKAFNNIATAHKQINTYGIGDIWEIATSGTVQYPLMWAKPENGRLETNLYISSWTLIFMDVVDNGERNENDVLSDMELVALDVVALLRDNSYEFKFDYTGASIERFTERFEDKVAGVLLRVDLSIPYTADRCQVPQSGLTITGSAGTSVSCADATVESSAGVYSATVASGGTLVLPDTTVNIYVNGELIETITIETLGVETINIED